MTLRTRLRSPERDRAISASRLAVSTVTRSPAFMPSIRFSARSLACSRRPSACMLAERSKIMTVSPCTPPETAGRIRARVSRIARAICRKYRIFFLSFWKGFMACCSASARCHRSRLGTRTVSLRRFSRYRAVITPRLTKPQAPAGKRKCILSPYPMSPAAARARRASFSTSTSESSRRYCMPRLRQKPSAPWSKACKAF